MNRLSVLLRVVLLLLTFVLGCSGGGGSGGNDDSFAPLMGILQFRIRHNLQDDSCLGPGDCFYAIEEEDQTAAWLDALPQRECQYFTNFPYSLKRN